MDAVQVANELRLPLRHIEAIESEDLTQLPGPSYICGYLRSYAKLLGLPSDEIVDNFPGVREYLASVKSTVMPTQMVFPTDEATRQAPLPGFTPANVGMVLAAGALAIFLIMQLSGKRQESPQVATTQPGVPASAVVQAQPESLPTPSSSEAPATVAESSPQQPTESSAAAAGQAPVEKVEPAPQKSVATVSDAATSSSTNPSEESAPAPVGSGVSRLAFQFRGESWLEVIDAANKRIAYELVPAGEAREVSGVAPFQVTLGAGSEVDIRLNDEVYDMRRYARAKMVILKIGKPEDNQPQASTN